MVHRAIVCLCTSVLFTLHYIHEVYLLPTYLLTYLVIASYEYDDNNNDGDDDDDEEVQHERTTTLTAAPCRAAPRRD